VSEGEEDPLFTINADKEYAFASKNKLEVFIRICCLPSAA